MTKTCSLDGCDRKHEAKGFCNMHYLRLKKDGHPGGATPRKAETVEEALRLRTERQGDCLVWMGSRVSKGYGSINSAGHNLSAHRAAWELAHGPIPAGLVVDHVCHNRACVEVTHLRLATLEENRRNLAGALSTNSLGIRNARRRGGRIEIRVLQEHMGFTGTEEEAIALAEASRLEKFGEFAGRG